MAYGLKYQTQFDSVSDDNNPVRRYTLQFLFKDYTGGPVSIDGGGVSVIQKRTEDDPKAPVQGQSLDIRLVNDGNIPITAFQSDDDDGVQVIFKDDTGATRFIGFLVQDDFYEPKVDFSHEIVLSANDSLGLLKGVILSDARIKRRFSATVRTNGPLDEILLSVDDTSFYVNAGDTLEVLSVTYTVVSSEPGPGQIGPYNYNYLVTVTPSAAGVIPETPTYIYLTGRLNLINRNSLLAIIGSCLTSTNLALMLNIYYNLHEYTQPTTESCFEQNSIDTQLFISGETYENCYDVLTKIMKTFNCSIFQANGEWNIVHWDSARQYALNAIPGYVYDESFTLIGTTVFNNNFAIGPDPQLTQPITQLTEGALRGYKFTRKTFNYTQPKYLLKNYDLQTLGALRSTYMSGGLQISEYEAPNWTRYFGATASDRFIRVAYDPALLREVDRYLVIRGANSDNTRSVGSDTIEISQGDKINFSASMRTNFSAGGPATIIFAVEMYDGTNTRFVDEVPAGNGAWISTVGFNYTISGGDNFNISHSVEIQSSQTPFSGLLTIWLPQSIVGSGNETHFKDIRLEVTQFIADSTKIIGHIHKQERPTGPKLFSDLVLQMDDSPRNTIVGTLFNPEVVNLLQVRTLYWLFPTDGNGWRLGELTTLEELRWRQKTRSKLEGGFSGNWQNGIPISLLTMVQTDFAPTKNYIFGLLNIDYKNNSFSGTLWELFDNNDPVFEPAYTFTYIYSTT